MPSSIDRRLSCLGMLAALALAACGGGGSSASQPPTLPPAVAPGEWVVLGTSTAAGVGAPPGKGWVARLADASAAYGVTLTNAARAGTTTYQWLPAATSRPPERPATVADLDVQRVLPAAPRLVVLAFPSNDAMAGYGAAETVGNLLLLRREALRRGAVVVVTSSQPRNDAGATERATMRAVDAALAPQLGPCFVDLRTPLADRDGGLAAAVATADGVHPNADGHRVIFEQVWDTIAGGRCTAAAPG
jgi:lysophospholipase L1-like esterase